MPEIGVTLRETRIREKIDITSVEGATKIRAKYLRALENEEWGVLPGPAYVKSFLRTYAEFLGLDAHMLVEEYRARYEQPEELEVPAFSREQRMRSRVRPPGPPSRGALIGLLALALLGVLFVLGITSDEDDGAQERPAGSERSAGKAGERGSTSGAGGEPRDRRRTAGRSVSLSVVPARDVWICLVNANGRQLVGGRTVTGGEREGPFRSRSFRITVGNGGGDLRINGKLRDLPDSSSPQGYVISRSSVRKLPQARNPTCSAQEAQTP